MKKNLPMLLLAATLITSCSKSSNNKPTPTAPTVLLSKITNITPGDPYFGQPLAEFTYNGKLLSKAVIHNYSVSPDVETDLFNYDSQGHLTGTAISHTVSYPYNDVSSTVTYSGNNIREIKFYIARNILDRDITISYQNGNIVNWLNVNQESDNYTYDSNGRNTEEIADQYVYGQPDGNQYIMTKSAFDDKSNLTSALPMWIYFRVYLEDESFGFTPGTNNPITVNGNSAYEYNYNNYGYPSSMTWIHYAQSYQYDYVQVN